MSYYKLVHAFILITQKYLKSYDSKQSLTLLNMPEPTISLLAKAVRKMPEILR
jgi:hypothetical protein